MQMHISRYFYTPWPHRSACGRCHLWGPSWEICARWRKNSCALSFPEFSGEESGDWETGLLPIWITHRALFFIWYRWIWFDFVVFFWWVALRYAEGTIFGFLGPKTTCWAHRHWLFQGGRILVKKNWCFGRPVQCFAGFSWYWFQSLCFMVIAWYCLVSRPHFGLFFGPWYVMMPVNVADRGWGSRWATLWILEGSSY